MIIYKLTDQNDQSHGGMQWGKNVERTVPGGGPLCTRNWLHGYKTPLIAVLMNPIHGNYDPDTMHLWETDADVKKEDGFKLGCTRQKTLQRKRIPKISINAKIRVAIYLARSKFSGKNNAWDTWATNWLSGKDRSTWAAHAAGAATSASYAAGAATDAATYAAGAAAYAAGAKNMENIDLNKIILRAVAEEKP